MKRMGQYLLRSTSALSMVLFFVLGVNAQQSFEVKWTMDYTQAGTSNHANFSPSAASLAGGMNTFTLPTVYSTGGAIVVGYITRPWPVSFAASRYMEFAFTANSFKYNISSISFRLRRSPNGPNQIKVRTSADAFASDLAAFTIGNTSQFNDYSVPVSFNNLSHNSFSVRIYAHNAVDIYGTLWFDEIKVNGQVLAIVLPIDLTYFKARAREKQVTLLWETAWEKNSKEFVIERSADLRAFEPIGSVNAAGETTGRTAYEYCDTAPLPGTSYYRLRQVDRNEAVALSKSVSVSMSQSQQHLHITPNPSSPECITVTTGGADPATFSLTTCSGTNVVFRTQLEGFGLAHIYPHYPLKSGLYLLSYVKDGRKEHAKVLVP
ncbi:hypothetical protein [Dyadobacter sp. MSC1_007]|jgi:hypothetical protein|uniref:hypothetical protein n=1 Tax=Dyadobacter sp. MSC1_007 TaxID=2909264 RepID=UPI00202E53E2|nr:hypothetical protein [Dyadobacter sp. MSC1_007]